MAVYPWITAADTMVNMLIEVKRNEQWSAIKCPSPQPTVFPPPPPSRQGTRSGVLSPPTGGCRAAKCTPGGTKSRLAWAEGGAHDLGPYSIRSASTRDTGTLTWVHGGLGEYTSRHPPVLDEAKVAWVQYSHFSGH
eukprot:scaffold29446_cov23-Cyclotella_meneghiniana.AAC.2